MVEVVRVALVLVLQFVKKVKELKCEGRRRAEHCCGKPACPEELNIMGGHVRVAVTVPHDKAMNAVQVEDHVVIEGRMVVARFAGGVTELNNLAEGGEGH